MSIITARGLAKTYSVRVKRGFLKREIRHVRALKGISFEIAPGELIGYIGPNGAGKSTTVKVLSGILAPDEGECHILGLCPWESRMKHVANIGVVFGQRSQLWWDLPVLDSFDLLRDIYRLSQTDYKASLSELTERLSLEPLLDIPVRQLSLGQRMRCELAASLLHRPKILFLDEPTIGLDAVTKLTVRDFISEINRNRGTTVILTTHDMDDIEALCTRVMLIGNGEILLDGDISALRKGHDERILRCELGCEANLVRLDTTVVELAAERNRLTVRFNPEETTAAALIGELNAKYPLQDVTIENMPIENVVARLYETLPGGGYAK